MKLILDLMFCVTESNGPKDVLENVYVLRDEALPYLSRKIAVWFVV